MKFIKRLFIFALILVFLVVGAALLAPILFKDQIVANVKQGINDYVNAEVDFRDVNVSFLRSFPAINLTIDDYSVIGIDTFAGYPLAQGSQASLDLDFWSVINGSKTGEYVIESVALTDPDIRLLVLNENLANYNIAKATEVTNEVAAEEAAVGNMLFSLQSYAIENGSFLYDDRLADTKLKINGLDHQGTGDFTLSQFELDTESQFDELTLVQGGIAYLKNASGTLAAKLGIDLDNSKYTFQENELILNALPLSFDGYIAMPGEDIDFDLSFSSPGTNFAQVWSLIPAAYTQDYQNLKAGGTFALVGSVKGPYNGDIPRYPAFNIKLDVNNGMIQYPSSPVAINGINTKVNINSPSSNLNQMVIDLPNFAMNLGGDPFQGSFKLSQPIKDPTVDADIQGKIDLAKWSQLMPLEDVQELSGVIDADLSLAGVQQSLLESGQYENVKMDGVVAIDDLVYDTEAYPKVQIDHAEADFTPQSVNIPSFSAQLGRSDLNGSASFDNLLAYFSPEKTLTGDINVSGQLFDANEWVAEDPQELAAPKTPAELQLAAATNPATSSDNTFNRFDFTVDASIEEIKYDTYQLKDNQLSGRFQANQMVVNNLKSTIGETSLSGNGTITDAWDYYFNDAVLGGQFNVRSPFFNLDDFMTDEVAGAEASSANEAEESYAVIPVPKDINLMVDLQADRVKYTDMELKQVAGDLVIQDGQVVIQDGKMNLLGGAMDFAGAYDTSEPGDPGFRFHYDLKSLQFNQAFQFLNSFQALAPVAKFLEGQFNSDLVVSGKLGKDLYPILSSIDAEGFLQTLDASMSGITPLQKVGNALNVQELSERIDLKGIKSWFLIEDGTVKVEPFNFKVAGIDMTLDGRHGLDMDMDYTIKAAVPRELIEGNIITGSAISALDQLAGQASKLGLNIQAGDVLNFGIGLTGSFSDPKTSVKLLGTSGDGGSGSLAGSLVDQAKDGAQAEVDEKVDELKATAENKLNEQKDKAVSMKDSIRQALVEERKRVQDSIANLATQQKDKVVDEAKKVVNDAVGGQIDEKAQEEIDKIKKDLEKFNPFKKKKKDGGR